MRNRSQRFPAVLFCFLALFLGLTGPAPNLAQLTPELAPGTVLTREQARARFGGGAADEIFDVHQRFLFLPGPLVIDGDFGDDYRPAGGQKASFDCILVDGDLQVSGRVRFYQQAPGLLVRGDLRAKTLETGDSFVRVLGDVDVTQAIIGNYNDGSLGIAGSATAPYLVALDHDWWVRGEQKIGSILDSNDRVFLPEGFETALFYPDVEQTLAPEVFEGKEFSIEKFLERLDRRLPVVRAWKDLHPGYVRIRAFVQATAEAEPAVIDRESTKLLKDLDALGFDRPLARVLIVQKQCLSRAWDGRNGGAAGLARWGECSETLAGLLPAAPTPKPYHELTESEEAILEACGTLNEYGWYVFEQATSAEELQRAVRVMRKALPWVRPWENVWNVLDTAVRVLLEAGRQDEAFREVREALKRDGDFADFQDLKSSKEYQAWLRKR